MIGIHAVSHGEAKNGLALPSDSKGVLVQFHPLW
jgi:hypothetical protein